MIFFNQIKKGLIGLLRRKKEIEPSQAYDLWASNYDEQNDNPIIYLDEIVFTEIFSDIDIKSKTIVDVGCGTGRHWEKILDKKPLQLIGYEVSNQMLVKLHQKYPQAKTYSSHNNDLKELMNNSCDIIISNLVIGYIKDLQKTFTEWNRVLKKNGDVFITDFHPVMLQKGANRSFRYKEKQYLIRNHIHSLTKIRNLSGKAGWKEINLIEKKVDDTIKHFYHDHNSLKAYEDSFGSPMVYAFHFKKQVS